MIDTHCHFDAILSVSAGARECWLLSEKDFSSIRDFIAQAKEAGIEKFFEVGCNLLESQNSLFLSQHFSEIYSIVGLHPTTCNESWKSEFDGLKQIIANRNPSSKLIGIGEIGVDFFHKPYSEQRQRDAFLAQLELAANLKLPVSIHVRDARDVVLQELEKVKGYVSGVIHCFSQDLDFAKQAIDWGFVLGIGGTLTYPKNQSLRDIVKAVGIENLVLETDAPFLPPQAFRGKLNHPALMKHTASLLAEILGVSDFELKKKTSENATRVFRLN